MSTNVEREEENVRSLNSHEVSLIRFQNRTGRRVNLIWIDYQGRRRIQLELETDQGINYNTYVTHPWRAEDTENKNVLLLNFLETYYPSRPEVSRVDLRQRRALVRTRVRRIVVNITTPGSKCQLDFAFLRTTSSFLYIL